MGALAAAYQILKAGSLWSSTGRCKGYAVANPAEAKLVDGYVAALDRGEHPTPPALATATGRGLVGMLNTLATPAPPRTVTIAGIPQPGSTLTAAIQ